MDEQVTLIAYADQVRELIRNDRNDEAIAICKHILRYYPKHLDAYRQLGEALLEKGRLADAKELFRRVLSADPENVVAYAGLAVILEQEHLIAEATWHMERAFELAPGNVELHKELYRLYHELDGRPRARLKLTPGALARIYVREGLFAQAIQELTTLVAANDARFDARVALAETLWRVGQMRQAADAAQVILKALPFCLKANLILGAVWKETGLAESEQYLQRAQSLDPTNQTAQKIFGARTPLPFIQARVPRYVEGAPVKPPLAETSAVAEPAITPRPAETPGEILRQVPEFDEATFKPPLLDTTLPPWLLTPLPEIVEEKTAPIPTPEPVAEAQIEPAELPQEPERFQPEPVVETTGELPTWLAQLRESSEPEVTPPVSAEPMRQAEGDLPPWMRAESQAEETAPTTPAWIEEAKSATEEPAPPAPKEEIAAAEASPLPTWIADEPRAEETPPASPTIEARAEVPTWLSQLTAQPESAPAQPEPRTEEIPTWTPPVAPSPEPSPRAEEFPTWLSQPAPPAESAPMVEPPVSARESAAPAKPSGVAAKRKPATRGDSHLILARAYRDAHQFQEALGEYDYIVQKAPRLINQVIPDLEMLVKQAGVPLEVHRILGDAYTRADRLAEALEEYRFVLGRVAS